MKKITIVDKTAETQVPFYIDILGYLYYNLYCKDFFLYFKD